MVSPEAEAWAAANTASARPTNFGDMARVRRDEAAGYEDAARRAGRRHRITMTTTEIGGVVCDLFTSASARRRGEGPLLYVFGGAFMMGDPFTDLPVIGALCELTGLDVVAPRYRLAPEHPSPAAIGDVEAVYRALVRTDRSPAAVAGESAGGNLALLVAQRAVAAGIPRPAVLALLSPAADLRADRALYEPNVEVDPTLHFSRIEEVSAAYVADSDPADPTVSPGLGVMDGLPPTIITTGTRDLLMAGCVRLRDSMEAAGVEVTCQVWDGLWHVFEFDDQIPEQAQSLAEISAFITKHLDERRR